MLHECAMCIVQKYIKHTRPTCAGASRGGPLIHLKPITLEGHGVRLEPMNAEHAEGIRQAASNGELWKLWYTAVPEPENTDAYIQTALAGQKDGHMLPWVVRELATGKVAGSTRYHDVVAAIDR